MRPSRNLLSKLILAALVLALAGCSMVRLGYVNGDTFVYWWMNSYVGFSSEQKPWVKREIEKFFAWHRQTQLPDYARILARTQQRLGEPVDATDIEREFEVMRQRAERIVDFTLPSLARLALSLTPDQIANIERKFASKNEEYRKERLLPSESERQEKRFEKVMKHAEYWFGRFDAAQKRQIRAVSDARVMDYEVLYAERLARQGELIATLKKIQAERPRQEAVEQMLRTYASKAIGNFTSSRHKEFFDASRQGMAGMTAGIINLATPKQKQHARRQLQKLIDDGYSLAGIRAPQQLSKTE